jgi:predicted phosphodiesterase
VIAVFSDIHGNEKNLRKAFPMMAKSEALLFLGDAVGYRSEPAETLRFLKNNTDASVQGNHDAAATGQFDEFYHFIPPWLEKTLREVEEVDEDLFAWLARRPKRDSFSRLEMVHGSFRDPLMEFLREDVVRDHFRMQKERISLVGHTHQALGLGSLGNEIITFKPHPENLVLDLTGAEKWALNPGSLGARKNPFWLALEKDKAIWHPLA